MFGKKDTEKENNDVQNFTNRQSQNQIRTLISEGCKFEGNLFSPAYTKIDGLVKGNLTGESGLIIGEKGKIEGDVTSIEVVIYGEVKGNVKSHKLEIKKGGKLNGDANIEHMIMEYGSRFSGKCNMRDSESASSEAFDLPEDQAETNP